MDSETFETIKATLTAERQRLLDQQFDTLEHSTARERETGQDSLDESTAESIESTYLRLRSRDSRLLPKIEKALKRMESGVYLQCEECEEEIGEARLKARPVTTYCIDCKERQELEESKQIKVRSREGY